MSAKNKKLTNTFILISILTVVAGGLLIWQAFFAPRRTPLPPVSPTPTPESRLRPSPSPIPLSKEERGDSPQDLSRSLKQRFPLVESVPYETDRFSVDYRAPLQLEAKIKVATEVAAVKKEVTDWIWAQGVNPGTHKIDWITPAL